MKMTNIPNPRLYSIDELRGMGKRLRLSSLVEYVADLSSNPQCSDWGINQWLGTLFESEIERREGALVAWLLHGSRFQPNGLTARGELA